MYSRPEDRNSTFVTGVDYSGAWEAEIVDVSDDIIPLVSVKIPRLVRDNVMTECQFVGEIPEIGDNVWCFFRRFERSRPLVVTGSLRLEEDVNVLEEKVEELETDVRALQFQVLSLSAQVANLAARAP